MRDCDGKWNRRRSYEPMAASVCSEFSSTNRMVDIYVHICRTGLAIEVGGVEVEPHRSAAAIEGDVIGWLPELEDRLRVVHRARAEGRPGRAVLELPLVCERSTVVRVVGRPL